MNAVQAWSRPEPLAPTSMSAVDEAVAELRANADRWVATGIEARIRLLRAVMKGLEAEAEAWVATSCKLKGIEPGSNAEGQEWLSGYLAMPRSVRYFIHALEHDGKPPAVSQRRRSTPAGDQWIVRVFPQTLLDKALFAGWNIDLWLEPGALPEQGGIYRRKAAGESWPGKVALVMGAGNQIFLGPTDALHKLFVDDEVVVLKMNPVNEVDGPHIERAFAPLIEAGFLRVVYGGVEVGKHLCDHAEVDSIHVTGSDATHDAIVWGADPEERARRKASGERLNERPFTSELGCVSPYIVTPGPWSDKELDYHARQLASALTQNAGHNCAAPQVLLIARDWELRDRFVARLEQAIAASSPRISYYPGSQKRWQEFVSKYPQHEIIGREGENVVPWTLVSDVPMKSSSGEGEWALTCEGFCGILNVVDIPTADPDQFLPQAVTFANEELWGNLSASLIVHPKTRKHHGPAVDAAIADLRYGTVAVNGWAGASCALMVSGWGGFPGNTQDDIQSGIGMAHNNLLWEPLQKSVLDLPFRIQPKPPWFVDHRNLAAMGRALVNFEFGPGLGRVLPVLGAALKG